MKTSLRRSGILALLALTATPIAGDVAPVHAFESCDAAVFERPLELEAWRCYWRVGRREGRLDEAASLLAARLRTDAGNVRARLYLCAIEADRRPADATPICTDAAEGLARAGESIGETYAWLTLATIHGRSGRNTDAGQALLRARAAAERAGDPILDARVTNAVGWQVYAAADYAGAYRAFREVEHTAFPDGPLDLRASCLSGLGASSWGLERIDESIGHYRREAEMLAAAGDRYGESLAMGNLLRMLNRARAIGEAETVQLAHRALEAALAAGQPAAEATARVFLAHSGQGAEAIAHAERAVAIHREWDNVSGLVDALVVLAKVVEREGPSRTDDAARYVTEAIELARTRGDLESEARARQVRATKTWIYGSRDDALAASFAAFRVIESLRDRQSDDASRGEQFTRWASYYPLAAGQWLAALEGGERESDLALALTIIERGRARRLLDRLDRAAALPAPRAPQELVERRRAIAAEIGRLQRRLVDPATAADERVAALERVESLESDERALRGEIARADPFWAAAREPGGIELESLRASLDDETAIVSYQIGPVSGEGSRAWVVVVTRDDAFARPLPAPVEIHRDVDWYLALLERGDRSEEVAVARLWNRLVAPVVDGLPERVRRWVVVADGPLHALPLAALAPRVDAPPLGVSHRLTRVPSIATWQRLRSLPESAHEALLAIAAPGPTVPAGDADPGAPRGALFDTIGRLPALTRATAEARAVLRRFGGGTLLEGGRAGEAAVKQHLVQPHALIHVAAHAVVDERHPERTAIVLDASDDGEDGLLQFREIADLRLDGAIVVLSTCQGASGVPVRGEGILGLAHALFQAGAVSVVGPLFPVRDDEAEQVAVALAGQLARGLPVDLALSRAREELRRSGLPARAWAGFVALGDADRRIASAPIAPVGRLSGIVWGIVSGLIGSALLVLGGWRVVAARRNRTD